MIIGCSLCWQKKTAKLAKLLIKKGETVYEQQQNIKLTDHHLLFRVINNC